MEQKINHMVMFCLKHDTDSQETEKFLSDGRTILTQIPGVENFEVLTQVSSKNEFDFGFSMDFVNQEIYDGYSNHPNHVEFVNQRWKVEVSKFLEMDFQLR